MKPPRSPRTLRLLDSLENICVSDTASPSERLAAATLAARILGRKHPTKPRKKKVKPAFTGSDLVPARPDLTAPAKPADILRQFSDLAPVKPV
jgi:hypothetical protein